jgi:hypothetical protein
MSLWRMWLMMLDFVGNKPYPIWSYRTPNMDKTLEKCQVVCYMTNSRAIVFQQIYDRTEFYHPH